jgi:hypothetical protein
MRVALLAAGGCKWTEARSSNRGGVLVQWLENAVNLLRLKRGQRPLSTRRKYHKRVLTGW